MGWGFQSTPSEGRATTPFELTGYTEEISIHALRGEGDVGSSKGRTAGSISIHALRGEGDVVINTTIAKTILFQSTPSEGRATGEYDGPMSGAKLQSTPTEGRAT